MKNNKFLKEILNTIVETVYRVNSKDDDVTDKINKIKNDSNIFDPKKDSIAIESKDENDTENIEESEGGNEFTKKDILEIIEDVKKKKVSDLDSYIKTIKKADREIEMDVYGPGFKSKDKAHKDKSKYDRKRDMKINLNDNINEQSFKKSDIKKMIIEKKHNAKVYTKKEILESLENE